MCASARRASSASASIGRSVAMNDLLASVGGGVNVYETRAGTGRGDGDDVETGTTTGTPFASFATDATTTTTTTISDATDATDASSLMATFFADVQRVKTNMGEIRAALVALFDAHEASKRSTTAEETRETRSTMTETIERVSKIARETKLRLENLDADNERAVKSGAVTEGSSEHRTRSTLTSSLKTKLKDQMGEFQELRERLRDEYKEIVERRYFTVTGSEAKEEDIERLIETGESETMFQNALLERGRGQIMDTVNEIQERHSAIRELERKLLELNQIFLDMSVLVEAQGEMIDNVASHVAKSVVYVQQGHVELRHAREYQKNTRKWACCISVILLIVLIAILLPVLKPWKSGSA